MISENNDSAKCPYRGNEYIAKNRIKHTCQNTDIEAYGCENAIRMKLCQRDEP